MRPSPDTSESNRSYQLMLLWHHALIWFLAWEESKVRLRESNESLVQPTEPGRSDTVQLSS